MAFGQPDRLVLTQHTAGMTRRRDDKVQTMENDYGNRH